MRSQKDSTKLRAILLVIDILLLAAVAAIGWFCYDMVRAEKTEPKLDYEYEAALLQKVLAPLADVPQSVLVVIVLAIGVVIFKLFYMFVGSVYHYIPNDVIPPQFLTRFYGVITIVNSGAAAFFNYFFYRINSI